MISTIDLLKFTKFHQTMKYSILFSPSVINNFLHQRTEKMSLYENFHRTMKTSYLGWI
jgi:hypothetical protein